MAEYELLTLSTMPGPLLIAMPIFVQFAWLPGNTAKIRDSPTSPHPVDYRSLPRQAVVKLRGFGFGLWQFESAAVISDAHDRRAKNHQCISRFTRFHTGECADSAREAGYLKDPSDL